MVYGAIKNNSNRAKFADTGIVETVRLMEEAGAKRSRLTAKIAGGACMFAFAMKNNDALNVGEKNVRAVKKVLEELKIPILADDTGLNYGRTVIFYPESGEFVIRSAGKPEKII